MPLKKQLAKALAAPDPLAKLIEEPYPGVFTFDAFTRTYCKRLLKELSLFEDVAPNSMNRYGRVLRDIGYGSLCEVLLFDLVNPLVRRLYPSMGRLHSYHGFTVGYSSKQRSLDRHFDSSDMTLNICLGGEFTGGKLVFRDDNGGVLCKLDHTVGKAVLHPGDYMHQAQNIKSGTRTNLILWCIK
jgi:hypothetical protein